MVAVRYAPPPPPLETTRVDAYPRMPVAPVLAEWFPTERVVSCRFTCEDGRSLWYAAIPMKPRPAGMSRRQYVRRYLRFGSARLLSRARAKWYFRNVRSVGKNLIVRGRPLVTNRNMVIGDNVTIMSTHRRTHFTGEGLIELKDHVIINSGAMIMCVDHVTLEEHAGLSIEAVVSDSNLHPIGSDPIFTAPVVLGSGSWTGLRAVIMPGVRVGSRAIVAACSVVTKDVEDDTMVAGIPAKLVRKLEYPEGQRTAYRRDDDKQRHANVFARASAQLAEGEGTDAGMMGG